MVRLDARGLGAVDGGEVLLEPLLLLLVALGRAQVDAVVAVEAQPDEMRQAKVDGEVARGLGRDSGLSARTFLRTSEKRGPQECMVRIT